MQSGRMCVVVLLAVFALGSPVWSAARVSVVTFEDAGAPVRHGLDKMTGALAEKGANVEKVGDLKSANGKVIIVADVGGKTSAGAALLAQLKLKAPTAAEALLVRTTLWKGKKAVLLSGADERGLMYALLDTADRIGWAQDKGNPLSEVRDATEKPYVSERAASMYTMNKANFESFFYDEEHWETYLDMLAKNRFNTFALLFGYENHGYFSPPYPQFFDVEGFDDIHVVGVTKERQQRNVAALKKIIRMTHERGMNFTLGIWDHIYRGGVQGPRDRATKPTSDVIWGLTGDNLEAYTIAALAKWVRKFPEIDAIQFRMHGESGLKRSEMAGFWTNIYKVMLEHAPQMRFDARAKNFPHELIDKAVDMGVNMRMCTKYWMEQMGLPFHPTHVNRQNQRDRRHGYADMLRYPKRYDMHWRLWNSGTTRVLMWGDPEYARRFAESTHVYDGKGFEVSDPLTTKGQDHPHDMPVFDIINPKYKYYDWEFERQWHFFQVFGRMGYNPDTQPEVWRKEFESRYGDAAEPVEKGLHLASKVLPMIVSYCYPYYHFPTTRGWAEKQRQGDLPSYAKVEGTDTQQFLSPAEAAECIIEGKDSAKRWPHESSEWFADISQAVLQQVALAEASIGANKNNEFISTVTDLKILAYLALYHSHRARAGTAYALFVRSGDANALYAAIAHEGQAVDAWGRIVESAGDVYDFDLRFGRRSAGLSGHWRDELAKLKDGLEKLKQQRKDFKPKGEKLTIAHVPVRNAKPQKAIAIGATVSGAGPAGGVTLVYNGRKTPMKSGGGPVYRAVVPAGDVADGLCYHILVKDQSGATARFPQAGEISVCVSDDEVAPTVIHRYITSAKPLKPLTISAQVSDPSGVKWVRLRYRGVNQFFDYKSLDMAAAGGGRYAATVPAEDIQPRWDFMYLIEVMDECGNGKIYPDLEKEAPYIIVKLDRN